MDRGAVHAGGTARAGRGGGILRGARTAETPLPSETRTAPAPERPEAPAISDARAAVMCALAAAHLLALSVVLPHPGFAVDAGPEIMAAPWFAWVFGGLWAAIALEALWALRRRRGAASGAWRRVLLVCLLPPCRAAVCPEAPASFVWIPGRGWRARSEALFEELERRAALPMLWAALLVVPVVGVEFLLIDRAAELPGLALGLHFANALVWFCFALELAVMLPLAARKKQYCLRHWVNLVVVLLPVLGFLRALRPFAAAGAAGSGQFIRAWRLRGLAARLIRAALFFKIAERVMRRYPRAFLPAIREKREKKARELAEMDAEIRRMEERLARR